MWAIVEANWGKVIVGIIVLSITIYIAVLNVKIANRDKKIAEISQELELWKQTYSVLASKVAEQNAAIKKLDEQRKQAIKKRADSDKKAAAIVAQAMSSEARIKSVNASPSEQCEDEMKTIRQLLDASR